MFILQVDVVYLAFTMLVIVLLSHDHNCLHCVAKISLLIWCAVDFLLYSYTAMPHFLVSIFEASPFF